MENLWKMIAKARGVELDEEFLYSLGGAKYKYRISGKGLEMYEDGQWYSSSRSNAFIRGEGTIEKLPFRPQKDDVYYTFCLNKEVIPSEWSDDSIDFARLIAGVVFRTREEAEDYLPPWKERISKL